MHTGKRSLASDCPCSGISRQWCHVGWKSLLLAMLPFSFNQEWRKWRTEKGRVENEGWVKRSLREWGVRGRHCFFEVLPKLWYLRWAMPIWLHRHRLHPCLFCLSCFPFTETFTVLKRLLCLTAFAVAHQTKPCWGIVNGTLENVEC